MKKMNKYSAEKVIAAVVITILIFVTALVIAVVFINISNHSVHPFSQQYNGIKWKRYDDSVIEESTITLDGEKSRADGFKGRLSISSQGKEVFGLEQCVIFKSEVFCRGAYFICDLNERTDDELGMIADYSVGLMLANDDWSQISILQLRGDSAGEEDFELYDFIWTAPAELRSDAIQIIYQLSAGTRFSEDTWD